MGTTMRSREENTLQEIYSEDVLHHRTWLGNFGEERLKRWKALLKKDEEAAICEAITRGFLSENNLDIEPYEDESEGGPDFLCRRNGNHFYVEATCMLRDKVTEKTNLSEEMKASYYCRLTWPILRKTVNKTPRCSGVDAPCVVAVGTFHGPAGALCFSENAVEDLLTGTPKLSLNINVERGEAVGGPHQSTELENSAFIKEENGQIVAVRKTISALILCPLAWDRMKAVGVLHPEPNHPFDPSLLPKVKFCKLAEGWKGGQFSVEWL
jgi:hypothetical protein